jgi:hypothetical protein
MTIKNESRIFRHWPALAATLALASGAAQATLKSVEQAYELGLGDVSLPGSDTGQLVVRPCAGCRTAALRVGAATRYILRPSATPVTRTEFAAGVARITSRAKASIFVYYEPSSGNVRRIVLQPGR